MTLSLDPKTTALVLIDLQSGILAMPLAPHNGAELVDRAAALGRLFREAGALIIGVHVDFAKDYADKPNQLTDVALQLPAGGLPEGWSDLAPAIGGLVDVTVTKRHWGAFHGTDLDLQLRRRGISTIVLAGVATNFGVEQTAREAWQHNYAVVIAADAATSFDAEMHRFSVEKILPRVSRVRSSEEIAAALG